MTEVFNRRKWGEAMRALRGRRSAEEVATLSGVPFHTMLRLEKGQIEKPAFNDVVLLSKFYGLTPDQAATLGEMWVVPADVSKPQDPLTDELARLGSELKDLSYKEQKDMLEFFKTTILVNRRLKASNQVEAVDDTWLPDWAKAAVAKTLGDDES